MRVFVPSKIKDLNVKVFIFDMITNWNEAKALVKHISCDCKYKFNSTTCNSNRKWSNEINNVSIRIIVHAKKVIVGILAYVLLRIVSI